jgi:hypothetical protein
VTRAARPSPSGTGGPLRFSLAAWFAVGVLTCSFCGRTATEGAETLTWTTAVENGTHKTFCDECSRQHVRAMESKLDSEWW